jgi:hypothetical protein
VVRAFDRGEVLGCVEEEDPKGMMGASMEVRQDSSLLLFWAVCACVRACVRACVCACRRLTSVKRL